VTPVTNRSDSIVRSTSPVSISGSRYCGDYLPGLGVDLSDDGITDLEQVLAVERGSRIGRDVERAQDLPAFGVKSIQFFARCKPNFIAVEADPGHIICIGEGAIFTDDFSG